VVNAGSPAGSGRPDVRLSAYQSSVPSTAANESAAGDGGFVVPPTFVNEVVSKLFREDSLMMQCDLRTSRSLSLDLPLDESADFETNFGIKIAWEDELADLNLAATKEKFGAATYRLRKIVAFLPITENLFNDSVALAEHVSAAVPQKMAYAVEKEIIAGT